MSGKGNYDWDRVFACEGNPLLFTTSRGRPIEFHLQIIHEDNSDHDTVMFDKLIVSRNGRLVKLYIDMSPTTVLLAGPNSFKRSFSRPCFKVNYIFECIFKDELLDLRDYFHPRCSFGDKFFDYFDIIWAETKVFNLSKRTAAGIITLNRNTYSSKEKPAKGDKDIGRSARVCEQEDIDTTLIANTVSELSGPSKTVTSRSVKDSRGNKSTQSSIVSLLNFKTGNSSGVPNSKRPHSALETGALVEKRVGQTFKRHCSSFKRHMDSDTRSSLENLQKASGHKICTSDDIADLHIRRSPSRAKAVVPLRTHNGHSSHEQPRLSESVLKSNITKKRLPTSVQKEALDRRNDNYSSKGDLDRTLNLDEQSPAKDPKSQKSRTVLSKKGVSSTRFNICIPHTSREKRAAPLNTFEGMVSQFHKSSKSKEAKSTSDPKPKISHSTPKKSAPLSTDNKETSSVCDHNSSLESHEQNLQYHKSSKSKEAKSTSDPKLKIPHSMPKKSAPLAEHIQGSCDSALCELELDVPSQFEGERSKNIRKSPRSSSPEVVYSDEAEAESSVVNKNKITLSADELRSPEYPKSLPVETFKAREDLSTKTKSDLPLPLLGTLESTNDDEKETPSESNSSPESSEQGTSPVHGSSHSPKETSLSKSESDSHSSDFVLLTKPAKRRARKLFSSESEKSLLRAPKPNDDEHSEKDNREIMEQPKGTKIVSTSNKEDKVKDCKSPSRSKDCFSAANPLKISYVKVHHSKADSTKNIKEPSEDEEFAFPKNEHLSPDSPKRRPYSRSDDIKILKYLVHHGYLVELRGTAVWKKMAKRKVLPNRTHQSLKNRFLKSILPKLELFDFLDPADITLMRTGGA